MHLNKRWKRIRSLVLAWSFVPTVIVLAAVAVFTYLAYQRVTNDLIIERDRELTYLSASRLQGELSKYTDILVAVSRNENIYSNSTYQQRLGLKNAQNRLTVFDAGVVLLDNLGKVVGVEPERSEIIGMDWSDRPYFSQMLASHSPVFSNILSDGPLTARVVSIAVPVTGPAGELHGALVGMFRLGSTTISPFYASIVRLRISESGTSYLVDNNAKIIYHTDISRTGDDVSFNPVVKQVMGGHAGAMRTQDTLGRDIVAAYAPVPGTPWGLVTEEDWATLTASSRRYGQVLLLLLGLGMFLPALGVAQLVRQRNREALERERIEHELQVAQVIQKTLLPKDLPVIPGWEVAAHWQPARAVSGDFYDFIPFPDGNIGVVIADVTDKGVPAGLVMASTRSILRGTSERLRSPGLVLERVNNLLCNDIPRNMFVTCLYAELDPATGRMRYANAGQNLPYRKCNGEVSQIDATGLPLGLMPNITYDEFEIFVEPGEVLLFYSDGMVEAHDKRNEMYGNGRLAAFLQNQVSPNVPGEQMLEQVLSSLHSFTGEEWNQEDDVTLVTVRRLDGSTEEEEMERSLEGE